MNRARVGVLGASGDIGKHLVTALLRTSIDSARPAELRLAARRPDAIIRPKNTPTVPETSITTSACDVRDHDDLARFADGLDIVVNATGPSHDRALVTAPVVLIAGADYVDVGGPADARALSSPRTEERVAVFHAGALPGASGILPRWLLSRNSAAQTLTVITGGRGAFTRAGAEDYLAGLEHGDVEPLAAWRHGRRVSQAAGRRDHVVLDGFPDPVSLFPYLDADGEAIALGAGLTDGTWYSAMVGDGVMDALMLATGMGLEAGSSWLRDASVAMSAGRRSYVVILAETETERAVLHAPGESVLAAEIAAAATLEVLARRVPAGYASAASVLDLDHVLAALVHPGAACRLVTTQDARADLMEEGTL
ncbi:MAG: saccharopine dehydrogenase NADP-binding domain-containing protein [Dermatophilaceae bacterium]